VGAHDLIVVRQGVQGAGAPWVCVPALSGTATPYLIAMRPQAKAAKAGGERVPEERPGSPLFALQSVGLDGAAPLENLDAIAADFVARLARAAPSGPLRLVGWSFGAISAFVCAKLLVSRGRSVESLVLLDPPRAPPEGLPTREQMLLAYLLE